MFRNALVAISMMALFAGGCAVGDGQDYETSGHGVKTDVQVEIMDVGYGGTVERADGDRVILPEFFVLFNYGKSRANVGGFYLTDGNDWGGDGLERIPNGTTIAAGDMLVIANYPPVTHFESYWGYRRISFEEAYGYAPDLEITGWDPEIDDLISVRGRIRLKHGHCSYDGECWSVEEPVALIDGSKMDDAEAIYRLDTNEFNDENVVSLFPIN